MIIAHIKKRAVIYSYILTAILVVLFANYIKHNKETFRLLLHVSPGYLFGITALIIFGKIVIAIRFKAMIDFFGLRLRLDEWFGLPCISNMINYFLPGYTGPATQAMYLRQAHGFEYSRFTNYLAILFVFNVAVCSFLGVLFVGAHYLIHNVFFMNGFIFFSALFITTFSFLVLVPVISVVDLRWDLLNKTVRGFHFFFGHKNLLIFLVIMYVAEVITTGLRFFLAYRALGTPIDFLPALTIGLVALLSMVTSLTPGSLGIREALLAVASVMVGQSAALGVAASLLDRALGTVIAFAFGIWYAPVLAHKKEGKGKERAE